MTERARISASDASLPSTTFTRCAATSMHRFDSLDDATLEQILETLRAERSRLGATVPLPAPDLGPDSELLLGRDSELIFDPESGLILDTDSELISDRDSELVSGPNSGPSSGPPSGPNIAQDAARTPASDRATPRDDELRRVVQDLQIHQIELVQQNRELRSVQQALELSRDRYAELYDWAPVGYCTLDRSGTVIEANLTAARMLGVERGQLVRHPLAYFLRPSPQRDLLAHISDVLGSGQRRALELRRGQADDDHPVDLRLESEPATSDSGEPLCRVAMLDITERKAAERGLRLTQFTLDHAPDPVYWVDEDGRILYVNSAARGALGYGREELLAMRMPDIDHDWSGARWPEIRATQSAPTSDNQRLHFSSYHRTKDGARFPVDLSAAPIAFDGHQYACIFARDMSAHQRREQALVDAAARLELALSGGDIGLYEGNLESGEMHCDARCLAMLGYPRGAVALDGKGWQALIHPRDAGRIKALHEGLRRGDTDRFEIEYRLRHRSGNWVWVLDRGRVHAHAENTPGSRFSGSRVDVTRRKSAEFQLKYLADHDTLTGLYNRRGVDLSLLHAHAQCLRTNTPHCVAILDLDHFKRINDQHGHKTGDQVLKTVAERLRTNAREADWIGRWGGEEFLVFLHGATESQALEAVERLRLAVAAQPIDCDGLALSITLSAGLADYRLNEDKPDRVLVRADRALYRAKHDVRNRSCIDG